VLGLACSLRVSSSKHVLEFAVVATSPPSAPTSAASTVGTAAHVAFKSLTLTPTEKIGCSSSGRCGDGGGGGALGGRTVVKQEPSSTVAMRRQLSAAGSVHPTKYTAQFLSSNVAEGL
jgi:hypothetical protein